MKIQTAVIPRLISLVAALGLGGCAGGGDEELAGPPPGAFPDAQVATAAPIGIGDSLELFVKEDKSFDGTYRVRERGDLIIPELGRIPVYGLSLAEAERKIKQLLESRQLTSASVILDRVGYGTAGRRNDADAGTTIYLSGKVNKPGRHIVPFYQGRTPGVYEALLICGGLARFADENRITLLRHGAGNGKKEQYVVNLERIKEGEEQDFPIVEGDILVVKEKMFGL